MTLTPLDKAFLIDVSTTNWMHHFVVVAALKRTGAETPSDSDALVLKSLVDRHNLDDNLSFWGRQPITLSDSLSAQVQSIVMLRVFQERIAAIEMLGALLLALSRRAASGIALSHYEHTTTQIARFYSRVLAQPNLRLWELIGWPDPDHVSSDASNEAVVRYRRIAQWLNARVTEVARAYLRPEGLSLGTLGHIDNNYDPRESVFVILFHESRWREGRELDQDLIVKAYNMVKHGFNATTLFREYEGAAAAGPTAIVLEVPKSEEMVQRFGQEVDLVGVLSREFARMTIELDDARVLPG